jgi:hypothetical protein
LAIRPFPITLLCAGLLAAFTLACEAPNPFYQPNRGGTPEPDAASVVGPDMRHTGGDGAVTGGLADGPEGPGSAPDAGAAVMADAGPAGGGPDAAPGAINDASVSVSYKGDLKRGLALYLPLDDPARSGVAEDASGKQSTAALKSIDATAAWGTGHFGGGLALKGPSWSGWVDVSGSTLASAVSQGFTVALWIWRAGDAGTLVSRRSFGARGTIFAFNLENGALAADMNTAASYRFHVTTNSALPTGRWVHAAMTYDLREVRLYVDGTPMGGAAYLQPLPLDTSSYMVGGLEQQDHTVTGKFPGQIDDVVLYTRVLTDDELSALAGGARPLGK